MTITEPKAVSLRDMADWCLRSVRLVFAKPACWIATAVALFGIAVALTFVPLAGNALRELFSELFGAFILALVHTQAAEGRISVRRAAGIVAPALPMLIVLGLVTIAVYALLELPVLRLIGTESEFRTYAFADMKGGPARFGVDLVHTSIIVVASCVMAFAGPLVMFARVPVWRALRRSALAFSLSPAVYVAFAALAVIVPHSIGTSLGLAGVLFFFSVSVLLTPSAYFVYRSAFPHGFAAGCQPTPG